jgi:hypothetical protein
MTFSLRSSCLAFILFLFLFSPHFRLLRVGVVQSTVVATIEATYSTTDWSTDTTTDDET